MKFLSVFGLCITLSLGVFFTSPQDFVAHAQTGGQTAVELYTYDYARGIITGYRDTAIQAIDAVTARSASGTPEYATQLTVSTNVKNAIEITYQEYIRGFNQARALPDATPAKAQIAGIQALTRSAGSNQVLRIVRNYTSSPQISAFNTYSLNSQNELRNAIQTDRNPTLAAQAIIAQTVATTTITNAAQGNQNTASQRYTTDLTQDQEKCSFFGGNLLGCIDQLVGWLIKNTLLQIAGWLLWLTANMLNYSIQLGILNFKDWAPDSLYPIWIIIRQIISLIIVFVGLYLGILYMLGRGDTFGRYIPWVVIFALFVNFSYPLARTAVDISNIISLNIYTSAIGSDALQATISSKNTAGSIIMNRLGLEGLVKGVVASSNDIQSGNTSIGNLTGIGPALLAIVFVLYAAYIFLIATGIIIMRTVILIFLIVASPILLVDSVLPVLGDQAVKLRKMLFEQLLVGPIFMLMLALTLRFLEVFSTATKSGRAFVDAGATSATVTQYFNILMMLIMLHIMITVTKKFAGDLGNMAGNAMGKVGGFGIGLASGGTGLLARKGIGGLALKAKNSDWVNRNQHTALGRGVSSFTNSLSNSTFDLRNTAVAGKMGALGMGMGMGAKMGEEAAQKQKVQNLKAMGANIRTQHKKDIYREDENGNMVIAHRKGDDDAEGIKAREQFFQNSGGALFLTKSQKEELDSGFVDEESAKNLKNYKQQKTKAEKLAFAGELRQNLDKLKTEDRNLTSPKAQALIRSIHEIETSEKQDLEAFDKQVEDARDKYEELSEDKKQNHLASLSRDVRDAVKEKEGLTETKESSGPFPELKPEFKETPLEVTKEAIKSTNLAEIAANRKRKQQEAAVRARKELDKSGTTASLDKTAATSESSLAQITDNRAQTQQGAITKARKELGESDATASLVTVKSKAA